MLQRFPAGGQKEEWQGLASCSLLGRGERTNAITGPATPLRAVGKVKARSGGGYGCPTWGD